MNVFYLDEDLEKCAQYHNDKHVVKQILEGCQLLCSAYPDGEAPYRRTHYNHPCAVFTRETTGNFQMVVRYTEELCKEYTFRYGKKHKCEEVLNWVKTHPLTIPVGPQREPPQCFKQHPDCMVENNPIQGYRNYYRKTKMEFLIKGKIVPATWSKRQKPDWI